MLSEGDEGGRALLATFDVGGVDVVIANVAAGGAAEGLAKQPSTGSLRQIITHAVSGGGALTRNGQVVAVGGVAAWPKHSHGGKDYLNGVSEDPLNVGARLEVVRLDIPGSSGGPTQSGESEGKGRGSEGAVLVIQEANTQAVQVENGEMGLHVLDGGVHRFGKVASAVAFTITISGGQAGEQEVPAKDTNS